mgnify:CR=1 FL=1
MNGAAYHLSRAIELDAGLVDAYNNLAQVLLLSGEINSSRENFLMALKLDQKNPLLHENLANFHLVGDKDFEQARIHFIAAISNGLDTAGIRFNLGVLMMDIFKDYRRSLIHFKRCIELNSGDHGAHERLALIYGKYLEDENAAKHHTEMAKKLVELPVA